MTEHEYTLKRLHLAEAALRSVMAIALETLPPRLAEALNRMGLEWDKGLDVLDAQLKSEAAKKPEVSTKGDSDV
jgi:hypothetical protein